MNKLVFVLGLLFARPAWAFAANAGVSTGTVVSSVTAQSPIADWPLIQSAGGIEVGPAIQNSSSTWKVAVNCDLGAHGSGVLIKKTLVTRVDNSIYLSFAVGHTVWTLTPERGLCQPVMVDSKPGMHWMYYRDGAGKDYPLGHLEFRAGNAASDGSY